MILSWFKQLLTKGEVKEISLEDISASVSALGLAITNNDNDVQKNLRRLALAQRQQNDAIAMLSSDFKSLKFTMTDRHGVILTFAQIMCILDRLSKINHAADSTNNEWDVIAPLIKRASEELLSLCKLEAIAEIRKIYPAQGCEVLGAIEVSQWEPGTVHEILQQGYRTTDGQIVREAKVIVCRELKQQEEIKRVQ